MIKKVYEDLVGQKYGLLTILEMGEPVLRVDYPPRKMFNCKCDCGSEITVDCYKLTSGHTTSCGCKNKTRDGLSKVLSEYKIWVGMNHRCHNPDHSGYYKYGAKGITVCDEWRGENGFQQFFSDIGPRPSEKHTIERVNVKLGYNKDNCIWTDDLSLQCYNQGIRSNNTSGRTGVGFDSSKSKSWCASIAQNGKVVKKCFFTFEEAVAYREKLELELYGFNKE